MPVAPHSPSHENPRPLPSDLQSPTTNVDSLLTGMQNSSIEGSHLGNQSHLSNANNSTSTIIQVQNNNCVFFPPGPNSPIGSKASPTPEVSEREKDIILRQQPLFAFQEKQSPADNHSEPTPRSPHHPNPTAAAPPQLKRFEMEHPNLVRVMDHRYVPLLSTKPIEMTQRYTLPLNQSPQKPEPDNTTLRSRLTFFRAGQPHPFTITLQKINRDCVRLHPKTSPAIEYYMRNLDLEPDCIALWEPLASINSRLHPQLQHANICLGDIGHFNASGGFDTKFNIFLPKKDNDLLGHCPAVDFVPLEDWPSFVSGRGQPVGCYFRSGNISSQSIDTNSDSWKFAYGEKKKPFGAALALPDGYCMSSLNGDDLVDNADFLQHLETQIQRYFLCIKATYREKTFETPLLLVTSVYYSKTWANITYSRVRNGGRNKDLHATLNRTVPERDIWRWKHSSPSDVLKCRSGPSESELDNGVAVTNNQCIGVEVEQIIPKRPLIKNFAASLSSIAGR